MKLNELMEKYGEYEVKEGFMDLLEKPKPKNVWDLKSGDRYFFLTASGIIQGAFWHDDISDHNRLSIGNISLTEEAAEFARERLEVIAELKRYAKEFSDEEWSNDFYVKYYIAYECSRKEIVFLSTVTTNRGDIYFCEKEKAKEAVDAIGEERIKKYYFGVKG